MLREGNYFLDWILLKGSVNLVIKVSSFKTLVVIQVRPSSQRLEVNDP